MKARSASVVLVGGSGGIGSATARRLFQEGYAVIVLDRTTPASGDNYDAFFQVDLTDANELEEVYNTLRGKYSKIWGLVHCAGIYPIVEWSQYTLELWDKVHTVNVRSVFQMARQLTRNMADGGRVVIVASGAGHIGSGDVGYSASKAGVLGLVRSLARTLASSGILVNAVSPGVIETGMSDRMPRERLAETLARTPMGRRGTPEEVAVCISFLLNKENSYMTGASIDVNGGLYAR